MRFLLVLKYELADYGYEGSDATSTTHQDKLVVPVTIENHFIRKKALHIKYTQPKSFSAKESLSFL